MFCTDCGTRLAPDSAFCHSCGGAVVASSDLQRRFAVLAEAPVFADPEYSSQIAIVPPGSELPIEGEGSGSYRVRLPGGQSGYIRKGAGMMVRPHQSSHPDSGRAGWRPGGLDSLLRTHDHAEASSRPSVSDTAIPGANGQTLQVAYITYLIVNGLLVVSTFLPWERLAFITASGLEVGRGWVVLIAALVAGVLAEESLRRGRAVLGLRLAQWGSGVAAMGMFALELIVISSACSGEENQLFDLCIRPGLGVGAVLAGIGGLVLGAAATFRHPRPQDAG